MTRGFAIFFLLFVASCASQDRETDETKSPGSATQTAYPREEVRKVIKANLKSYRVCHENHLKYFEGAYGKVVIEFTIGGKGEVLNARLKSSDETLHGSAIGECVVELTKKLQFTAPPPNAEVTVLYPFYFTN